MNEHDAYHQTEDTLRHKGHGVHGEHTTRYPAEEPAHTSCADGVCPVCNKTYAPAPAPAPKVTDAPDYQKLWLEIAHTLISVGLKVGNEKEYGDNMCAFIRALAQRAGVDRYTVGEVKRWLESLSEYGIEGADDIVNYELTSTLHGIKAVTTRADTRPDRGMESK